jgi:hypothetical protein
MQGIGEVHSTPHPSDRLGDATDVLANHGRQRDQLAESISDAAAIETIESAKTTLVSTASTPAFTSAVMAASISESVLGLPV